MSRISVLFLEILGEQSIMMVRILTMVVIMLVVVVMTVVAIMVRMKYRVVGVVSNIKTQPVIKDRVYGILQVAAWCVHCYRDRTLPPEQQTKLGI